jgi:hypothetical protein
MGFLNLSKSQPDDKVAPVVENSGVPVDSEKGAHLQTPSEKDQDGEGLSNNAQAGVKAIEAAATVWTKYHLIGAYVM